MTPYPRVRRILTDYTLGSWTIGAAWTLGPVFNAMSGFQPYSKIKLFYHVGCYNSSTTWGGAYIDLQYSINGGSWVSLGGPGYDGGCMFYSSRNIGSYNNTLSLDFKQKAEYSIQFRMYMLPYNGTLYVNNNNDFNNISGTAPLIAHLPSRYQHYTHIIVEEMVE